MNDSDDLFLQSNWLKRPKKSSEIHLQGEQRKTNTKKLERSFELRKKVNCKVQCSNF